MFRARHLVLVTLLALTGAVAVTVPAQAGTFGQLAAFGTKGTGLGQFTAPGNVTTDPKNGDVLVTDLRSALDITFKVLRFSSAGVFKDEVAYQNDPSGFFAQDFGGIAVGDNGVKHYLYIVRPGSGNAADKVQRYDLNSPATAPTNFSPTSFNTGAGRLDAPGAIAVNPSTNDVYIAGHTPAGVPVIQRFGSDGTKIGGQVGLDGVTTSATDDIEAMSVNPLTGDVLVLDHDPDDDSYGRILRFSSSLVLNPSATITTSDSAPFYPVDLAVAPDGTIAVAHAIPNTFGDPPVTANGYGVLEFSPAGTVLRSFGTPGTDTCQFVDSPHMAFAPTGGALFAADRGKVNNGVRRVLKFGAGGSGCGFDGSPPKAALTWLPFSPKTGVPVTFDATGSSDSDGTIAKYEWDLDGDGTYETDTGTTPTVTKTYSTAGTVNVGLRVTDDTGLTATTSGAVVVAQGFPPVAKLTATPNPAATGTSVGFDASGSTDSDGTIVKYEWDLDGNGTYETSTGATPTTSKTYAKAQTPVVGLRVTDDDGLVGTTTLKVTITNRPPTASFTATPASAPTGTKVNFDAGASSDPEGPIAKYEWDLDGNGTYETDTGTTPTTSTTYLTPGKRVVGLRVTDADGATATTTRDVTATNRPPTASFTALPNPAGTNSKVSFDASASADPDGSIVKYEWDLDGNGTYETDTGTTPTTSQTYMTAGTRSVGLRVTDDSGATAAVAQDVVITSTQPPVSSFTAKPSTAPTGTTIAFDGSASNDPDGLAITKYEWDLDGDGTYETDTGTTPTTSRKYAKSGVRTVRLRVTDASGDKAVSMQTVTITNRPPTASFTADPATAPTGTKVSFDGKASSDLDGTIAKYEWDLNGDGIYETDTGTTPTTSTTYATAGVRNVGLRVTDDEGATDSTTVKVTATNRDPIAAFTITPATAALNQTVSFDASGSSDPDGSIAKYEWDLDGNGTYETDTGTTPTTSTSYATPGTRTVRLRVTDDLGATKVVTHDVTVLSVPVPVASFTADPSDAPTGTSVTFDAGASTATGSTITKYEWDLDGNGTYETDTGTTPTATKTYATPGTRTVHLRITNTQGLQDTAARDVIARNRKPVAALTADPATAPAGTSVSFSATGSSDPDGSIAKYEWDLDGNGSFETDTGTTPTVSKSYDAPGSRTVHLRVTDDLGASDTTGVLVTSTEARKAPVGSFTVSPAIANVGEVVTLDARASTDADGRITDYAWDLNDDGVFETRSFSTPQITASFDAPGLRRVNLRVTDNDGLVSDTVTRTVDVRLAEVQKPPVDPPPTTPVPPVLKPVLTLPAGPLTFKATTKFKAQLVCPPGGKDCTAVLTIRTKGRRPTTVARASFGAAAGKTVIASFPLTSAGAKLLRTSRKLTTNVGSVVNGGTLTNIVGTQALALRADRKWKRPR